jgi:hypothetical protein
MFASDSASSGAAAAPVARWWRPPGARSCVLASIALTALLAAPVLLAPRTRLVGNEIVGRYHDPYTVALGFERFAPLSLFTQPATDWLGALAARAVGGVAAYNLVVLASFPLAAWFAYLLAFRVAGSRAGAGLAALAYAFAPFHLAHAAYHPHVAQTHWLPLYFLALFLALERASLARLALLLAALALAGLSNFYGGLHALVVTPFALAGGALALRRERGRALLPDLARVAGALALALGAAWGYVRLVAPAVLERPEALAFPGRHLARYTARPWSYVVPPVEHPLLGERARRFWEETTLPGDLLEQQLTVGVGLLALAAIGTAGGFRTHGRDETRHVPALLAVAACALACSLPPVWRLFGVEIAGPSALLYRLAPMFRAHARFGIVVFLAFAALAAIGLGRLLRRGPGRTRSAGWALVALAAFELTPFPPVRWRDVLPTRAHRWLRERAGPETKVLDCVPARERAERAVPRLFGGGLVQLPSNGDCGEPALPSKLAAQGFTHLLVRRASLDGDRLERRGLPAGLRPVFADARARLFAVEAAPAEVYLELGTGFFRRQDHGDRNYRWMGQRGTLRLVNAANAPRRATLRLVLHAMPHERRLLAALGGEAAREVGRVGLEPAPVEIGPLDLPPGESLLRLRSAEPATVADRILRNGDPRALTVALWEWHIGVSSPGPGGTGRLTLWDSPSGSKGTGGLSPRDR